jgi:hypothetical protein
VRAHSVSRVETSVRAASLLGLIYLAKEDLGAMTPKPLVKFVPMRLPERKQFGMTIAIGMQYHGGVLIAADNKVVLDDGSVKYSEKLKAFKGKSGIFAIVAATQDANASKTLQKKIENFLCSTEVKDREELEHGIATQMSNWHVIASEKSGVQFVFGGCLKNDGARLYFCEPPNTFVEINDGYYACGSGSSVTDPLQKMLFGFSDYDSPIVGLRKLSYLMYRAKKDSVMCGGRTHCALLHPNYDEPRIVNILDLEAAEKKGPGLDFLLHSAALFALSSTDRTVKSNGVGLGQMLENLAGLRAVEFHDNYGDKITFDGQDDPYTGEQVKE